MSPHENLFTRYGDHMKRCPTCRRIYTDDTLRFCLEDGAALRPADAPADADRTLALEAGAEPPPTKVLDDPALAPTRPARGKSSAAIPPRAESTWEAEPRHTMPRNEKRRSTGSVVALTVLATVLLLGLGGLIAWQLMKDDKQGGAGTRDTVNTNANVAGNTNDSSGGVVSTPTPTATPTPASGFIEGSMAYPSDGIPGVMVACAENAETGATVCSEKRDDWEAGVRYSLKVPPGRYFVYATLLAGDDSVGEMQGKKAYYTDYMKCGMGENCNSHKRIALEISPGQTLNGIIVGDWWADL